MKFQRISEDTIRCIVYKKDMQEYGIVLEDFFKDKGKVHDFLHEIVERAEQEVGYTPKEGMLSMQIVPINPNTLSITFSENMAESYGAMLDSVRNSMELGYDEKHMLDGFEEEEELEEYADFDGAEPEDDYEEMEKTAGRKRINTTAIGMEKSSVIMIGMSSLDRLAEFCRVLNINKTVSSELYRVENKGMYCLIIEKKRLTETDMRQILLLAVEYSAIITDELKYICHVREYGEVVINKSAYRILKNYV